MNRQIRVLGVVMMVLFTALFVQLNNLQIISAGRLNDHPSNTRTVVRDFSEPRGVIQTADGVVIAESVEVDSEFEVLRRYPEGPLYSHITGYFSFTYGNDGVERTYNDDLSGRNREIRLDRLGDLLLERDRTGNVTLTISDALQQVAAESLGQRKGAVVALDPRDGAILAFADYPNYDPNRLAAHDQDEVRRAWEELTEAEDKPLLPRTYRERYFPGSSFKVVTAATALASGVIAPDDPSYPVLRALPLPQTNEPLSNFGNSACGGTLPNVLRVSCNTAFAQMGLDLGGEQLAAGADRFGFNEAPPIDLPFAVPSLFPDPSAFRLDQPALAKSAIGQQDVAATPLQMALVAAAVANDGTIMVPHVMAEVRDSQAELIERFRPESWMVAVPPEVAHTMRDLMVGVVDSGSATAAQVPGVSVAGKTGTAQTGRDTSHTWFIAFAPAEDPEIAVAVMLENQPPENTGGGTAAPIAQQVLQAALG